MKTWKNIKKFFGYNKKGNVAIPVISVSAADHLMEYVLSLINRDDLITDQIGAYKKAKNLPSTERELAYIPIYIDLEKFILSNKPIVVKEEFTQKSLHEIIAKNSPLDEVGTKLRLLMLPELEKLLAFYNLVLDFPLKYLTSNLGQKRVTDLVKNTLPGTILEKAVFDSKGFHLETHLSQKLAEKRILIAFRKLGIALYKEISNSFGEENANLTSERMHQYVEETYKENATDFLAYLADILPNISKAAIPVSPETHKIFSSLGLNSLLELGFIKDYSTMIKNEKGISIPVAITGTTLKDSRGAIQGIVMVTKDLRKLKEYAKARLSIVTPTLQKVAAGDFSQNIEIPTEKDEFTEHLTALNVMVSDFRKMVNEINLKTDAVGSEKNKLEIIISGMTDGVIAVDKKRNIIIFNKAAEGITGFKEKAVLGKPLDKIIKVFDSKRELNASEYCPISEKDFEGVVARLDDLRILGFNKKQSFVNLIAGQIKEGTSVNLGCILTLHDVSRERELEEMKVDFVSMAAHELRTPLTSIIGYISVLMEENKETLNAEQKKFLTRVEIASKQLSDLVESLLNVSRIERGTLTIELKPNLWAPIAEQIVAEFSAQAKDKNIRLEFEKPEEKNLRVKIDPLRISEVLYNLLSNAVNYTNPGGKIKVWIEHKGRDVITHVTDSGVGIPEKALEHLFTKFFRVTSKMEQGSKGTGLGLYISKEIVGMHNGKIWVESEVGKGSTFSFSLSVVKK